MTDPRNERTIRLGRRGGNWGRICSYLGIGEYTSRAEAGRDQPRGWVLSPDEMDLLVEEIARRQLVGPPSHARRTREPPERAAANALERAIDDWRRECADPLSSRTPREAWLWACEARGIVGTPMPDEEPRRRPSLYAALEEMGASA